MHGLGALQALGGKKELIQVPNQNSSWATSAMDCQFGARRLEVSVSALQSHTFTSLSGGRYSCGPRPRCSEKNGLPPQQSTGLSGLGQVAGAGSGLRRGMLFVVIPPSEHFSLASTGEAACC